MFYKKEEGPIGFLFVYFLVNGVREISDSLVICGIEQIAVPSTISQMLKIYILVYLG